LIQLKFTNQTPFQLILSTVFNTILHLDHERFNKDFAVNDKKAREQNFNKAEAKIENLKQERF